MRGNLLLLNGDVDRGTNLEFGLFTNVGVDQTITAAAITEPVGTGYNRFVLLDANWVESNGIYTYAEQVFTGGVGGWVGDIYGSFIVTTGAVPRLLGLDLHPSAPHTIIENQSYRVTPQISMVKCP
jgi:hypothetical protein